MKKKLNKITSLVIIALIYLIAIIIAFITYKVFIDKGVLMAVFLADVAATIVVWLFGVILSNSSVYDPYWSIAPIVIVVFWLFIRDTALSVADVLLLVAVALWGTRLTLNWAIGWQGMHQIDWRYDMLKMKSPKIWQLTNFGGINLMPTVIVYLALVPAYYQIFKNTTNNIFMYIGFLVCIISAVIQLIADKQMKVHRTLDTSSHIDSGLWKYSRHPNYFGEVSFWWGIFIMQLGVVPNIYLSIVGAVAMTLLFVFISIPMMEKHVVQKRPSYAEYQSQVSMLVPWFRRS